MSQSGVLMKWMIVIVHHSDASRIKDLCIEIQSATTALEDNMQLMKTLTQTGINKHRIYTVTVSTTALTGSFLYSMPRLVIVTLSGVSVCLLAELLT